MSDEDSVPENVLFDLYREYIGEPDTRTDVYLGFGLFFVGILLAGVGLVLFLYSGTFQYDTGVFWAWREPAYALGMVSLPTALLGVLVLLPVKRRAVYAGAAGSVVTFVAVVWFSVLYPYDWNVAGSDASGPVVLLYGLGLAVVLAATGAALVAHQIQRYKPGPADIEPMEEEEPEETVSDEEIERDIEEAMADVDITWGGVERDEGTSLSLNIDESEIDTSGLQTDSVEVTRSESTDAQVQGLKALKGGEKKEQRSTSTVDDQSSALTELKQRREEEQKQQAAAEAEMGLVDKFKSFIGLS
jgi:hypothetical protein